MIAQPLILFSAIFDEMTRGYGNDENRQTRIQKFTAQAYQLGFDFF